MYGLVVILGLAAICQRGEGSENAWYVAHGARNDRSCGESREDPCGDLDYVIYNAFSGDTIYIETSDYLHVLCSNDEPDLLRKSLTIIGLNGKALVGCIEYNEKDYILKYDYTPGGYGLTMENIILTNGALIFGNGTLHLNDVDFINATVQSVEKDCKLLKMTIEHCNFSNKALCGNDSLCGKSIIDCFAADIAISDSNFEASPLTIAGQRIALKVKDSVFSGHDLTMNGVYVQANDGNVMVTNSSFTRFHSPSLSQYAMNLHSASLKVRGSTPGHNSTKGVHFECTNNVFQQNDRAITLIGGLTSSSIDQCSFVSNTAMHSGAAILALMNSDEVVAVTESTFTSNSGGKIMEEFAITENIDEASHSDGRVTLNKDCCKGVIDPVGRGGAIRLQKGIMKISDCTFRGNSANIQGGTIMADSETTLVMRNVHIDGANYKDQAVMGDIIYSRGQTDLYNIHVVAKSSRYGHSFLEHSGSHWSLKINRIWLQCPMGHNLRMLDVSSFGVSAIGMRSTSDMYNELAYYCDPCPYGSYSFDYGFLNNTRVPQNGSSIYYGIKINGEMPDEVKYTGDYVLHEVTCQACPADVSDRVSVSEEESDSDSDSSDSDDYEDDYEDSGDEHTETVVGEHQEGNADGEDTTDHINTEESHRDEYSTPEPELSDESDEEEDGDDAEEDEHEMSETGVLKMQCPISGSTKLTMSYAFSTVLLVLMKYIIV